MALDQLRHDRNRGTRPDDYGGRSPVQIDLRPAEYEEVEDAEPAGELHPFGDPLGLLCLVAAFVLAILVLSPAIDMLFLKFL